MEVWSLVKKKCERYEKFIGVFPGVVGWEVRALWKTLHSAETTHVCYRANLCTREAEQGPSFVLEDLVSCSFSSDRGWAVACPTNDLVQHVCAMTYLRYGCTQSAALPIFGIVYRNLVRWRVSRYVIWHRYCAKIVDPCEWSYHVSGIFERVKVVRECVSQRMCFALW